MSDMIDTTAWTATLLGLFGVAAAVGALRKPGIWQKLIHEMDGSPALQFVAAFMEMFVGAIIYLLAHASGTSDVLTTIMLTIGGLMMLEALVVMALSDVYFHMWLKNLAAVHRGWAIVTLLAAGALAAAGMLRLAAS